MFGRKKPKKKCGLCKKNRINKESAMIKLDCADGTIETIVCDECLGYLSPMISNVDL